ncbi:MAG: ABC transporter ATP-binding protein [Planctomycetota bacterium]
MPDNPPTLLQIRDLTKSFPQPGGGDLKVLDIAAFELAAGEECVLIGESGGGKTTLLHLIAGMTLPTTGNIYVSGYDIARLSEAGRDRFRAATIGYVFQTFNLLAGFSAIENIRLGMAFSGGSIDHQRAEMLLQRVGLAERAAYYPSQLSVGQQQRVAIARALAGKPKLLLADEPTANVDPGSSETVLRLIRETCSDENVGLLMVTHSMEVANQFDRVERLEEMNQ